MPSSHEVVLNSALTAQEMIECIRRDFDRLIRAEGMLNTSAAFGRCAYTLAIRIHHGNPFLPETTTRIESHPFTAKEIEANPALAAMDRPSAVNEAVATTTLHREITGPNAERVRLSMPVPVRRQEQSGEYKVDGIRYPAPPEGSSEDPGAKIVDEATARAEGWNIIDARDDIR